VSVPLRTEAMTIQRHVSHSRINEVLAGQRFFNKD
jgi:hypothetical protein